LFCPVPIKYIGIGCWLADILKQGSLLMSQMTTLYNILFPLLSSACKPTGWANKKTFNIRTTHNFVYTYTRFTCQNMQVGPAQGRPKAPPATQNASQKSLGGNKNKEVMGAQSLHFCVKGKLMCWKF